MFGARKRPRPLMSEAFRLRANIAFVASVGLALGKLHSHAHAAHAPAHAAHVVAAALFFGGVGDHGFGREHEAVDRGCFGERNGRAN